MRNQCALFHESNRMSPRHEAYENWTHVRALDGQREQLNLVFADIRCQLCTSWADMQIAVGLDHGCVHCVLKFCLRKVGKVQETAGVETLETGDGNIFLVTTPVQL